MKSTADELYEKLKNVDIGGATCHFSREKCLELAPLVDEIRELKKRKNAVILAHSYVSPEILYGVADYRGDSYGLSKDATRTDADIIVFVAVKFMGETAKILNPEKEVLLPSELNGCSLADSITAQQVKNYREEFPDHTFVCYINTSAEVKAECDVCVTSSNVYNIVENLPNDKIFFLPDRLMALNLKEELEKRGVNKQLNWHDGTCYVHEEYDPDMIEFMRLKHEDLKVASHPECRPEILHNSDFVGSTSQMLDWMKTTENGKYLMLTECGLGARLQVEMPGKQFVGTCMQCKYMKSNTLEGISRVLQNPRAIDKVEIEENTRKKALGCIEAMFKYAEQANPVSSG